MLPTPSSLIWYMKTDQKLTWREHVILSCQYILSATVACVTMSDTVVIIIFIVLTVQLLVLTLTAGAVAQSQQSQHAEVQMALLRAIPCMAMHQTALPFVQRALKPFAQPGAFLLLKIISRIVKHQLPMLFFKCLPGCEASGARASSS